MIRKHQSRHYEALRQQAIKRSIENNTNDNKYGYCERCNYKAWRDILQLHCRGGTVRNTTTLDDVILICPQCVSKQRTDKRGESDGK